MSYHLLAYSIFSFFAFPENLSAVIIIQTQTNHPHDQILIFLLDVVTPVDMSATDHTPANLLTSFDLIWGALLANSVRQSSWYNTE